MLKSINFFSLGLKKIKNIKISSSGLEMLKWIAIITMIIDHWGYKVISFGNDWNELLRMIGRISFPIFSFILIYNYIFNTSNKIYYIRRLIIFGVISQIPYIYFVTKYEIGYNIFVTFTISLIFINILEGFYYFFKNNILETKNKKYLSLIFYCLVIVYLFLILLPVILKADYGILGFLLIFSYYLILKFHNLYTYILAILFTIFLNQKWFHVFSYTWIWTLFSFFIIIMISYFSFYSKKSKKFPVIKRTNKWFFYFFYPIHLIIIKIISSF